MKLTAIYNSIVAWAARRDNPSKVTAGQAGTYTKAEIDNMFSIGLKNNAYPVTMFDSPQFPTCPTATPARTILQIEESKVTWTGSRCILPKTTFNLPVLFPDNYKDQTFWISIELKTAAPTIDYRIWAGPLPNDGVDNINRLFLYVFETDANGAIKNGTENPSKPPYLDRVTRFGLWGRLSDYRRGSAVRCISGNPSMLPTLADLAKWPKAIISSYSVNGTIGNFKPRTAFNGAWFRMSVTGMTIDPTKTEITGAQGILTLDAYTANTVNVKVGGFSRTPTVFTLYNADKSLSVTYTWAPERYYTRGQPAITYGQLAAWATSMNAVPCTREQLVINAGRTGTAVGGRGTPSGLWNEWGDLKQYGWPDITTNGTAKQYLSVSAGTDPTLGEFFYAVTLSGYSIGSQGNGQWDKTAINSTTLFYPVGIVNN